MLIGAEPTGDMPFANLVKRIRLQRNLVTEVPGFDPKNGNESAKYLFLLEAPGPCAKKSGIVSISNDDPTAKNLRGQLETAQFSVTEYAVWNVVPWYLGDDRKIRSATRADVREAETYLEELIQTMQNLRCIILMGRAARHAHLPLSWMTKARVVACHHTSQQSMIRPGTHEENIKIFQHIREVAHL